MGIYVGYCIDPIKVNIERGMTDMLFFHSFPALRVEEVQVLAYGFCHIRMCSNTGAGKIRCIGSFMRFQRRLSVGG